MGAAVVGVVIPGGWLFNTLCFSARKGLMILFVLCWCWDVDLFFFISLLDVNGRC